MTARQRLCARLPEAEDALIDRLLQEAEDAICAMTRRTAVPAALYGAQAALAVTYYNRMGIEGETGHSEGGVSREIAAIPEEIACQIRPYRLAKAGK